MKHFDTWKKAWALLNRHEKRNAWTALFVVVLSALSSAFMVGSVLPFLSVLSNPNQIKQVEALAWAFKIFGFTEIYSFLIFLGCFSFVVIVLACFAQLIKTKIVERFTMMHAHSLSNRLLTTYLSQPYEFFLNRHTGEMSTQLLQEAQQVVVMFLRPQQSLLQPHLQL